LRIRLDLPEAFLISSGSCFRISMAANKKTAVFRLLQPMRCKTRVDLGGGSYRPKAISPISLDLLFRTNQLMSSSKSCGPGGLGRLFV